MNELPKFVCEADPNLYMRGTYAVLDVETTIEEVNKLLLTAVRHNGVNRYKFGGQYEIADVIDYLYQFDFLVGHNIKYDLGMLAKAGLDLRRVVVYDTMIGEYVLHANQKVRLGLGEVSVRYGGPAKAPYIDLLMKDEVCPSTYDQDLLLSRCVLDIEQTERIFLAQRELLAAQGKLAVQYTRCLFTPCLADMESRGMQLDSEAVVRLHGDTTDKFVEVIKELDEFTGGINPKSSKQVAEFLYDTLKFAELTDRRGNPIRSATGKRMTDKESIAQLVPNTADQAKFVGLKKRQALLSADLDKALTNFSKCTKAGELLFANFNQTITATQRLSSTGRKYGVQFQNLKRSFKPLIMPRNDSWYIGECDGAQLEFRVAAYLGQDRTAVNDITNGVDVHSFTAQTITAAGQATTRQEAKAHTFKPLFGGMSGTKAEVAYYKAFKEKYAGIAAAQQRWIDEVLRTKKLVTETGLEFFWPDTKMTSTGFITNTQSICNYPVQSLATADIIPIAVLCLWHRMNGMQSFIINTVHDSVISEIHPDEVELYADLAVKCFTDDVYSYLHNVYGIYFNVPLGAGIKIGKRWGKSDEDVMSRLCAHFKGNELFDLNTDEIKYAKEISL